MRRCRGWCWTTATTPVTRTWTPTALEVRRLRRQADELAAAVTARTSEAATQLVARGLSVRDVAALLGISPQRVSQLTAKAS